MNVGRDIRRVLPILLAIGLCACHGVRDKPVLTVDARQALLEIPIPEQATWTWYRAETTPNNLEYQFDTTVRDADTAYSFGFYLFKFGNHPPDSGSLSRLLEFGQKSVWRNYHTIPGIWVRPELDVAGLMRLRLLDSEVVSMVFAGRPDSAEVHVMIPGAPAESVSVPIRYVDR